MNTTGKNNAREVKGRRRKRRSALFTRKKNSMKKKGVIPFVDVPADHDYFLEYPVDEEFQVSDENDEEAPIVEIKQEKLEGLAEVKIEPMEDRDVEPFTGLDGAEEIQPKFECIDPNCTKCKEQQIAYCFLHFHECCFEDNRCIVCCDLSLHLVGENSQHCSYTTLQCVFCARIFDELASLQEHDCNAMISKTYQCSMCTFIAPKMVIYFKHILVKHCGVHRLKCQHCLVRFHDPNSLKRHIRLFHCTRPNILSKSSRKAKERLMAQITIGNDEDSRQDEILSGAGKDEIEYMKIDEETNIDGNGTDESDVEDSKVEIDINHESEKSGEKESSDAPNKEVLRRKSEEGPSNSMKLCQRSTCTICYDRAAAQCLLEFHGCPVISEDRDDSECVVCLQVANYLQLVAREDTLHVGCSTVRCVFCLLDLPSMLDLKTHNCKGITENKCRHCGVMMKTFEKLCVHLFYHFNIKAFKCEQCGMGFVLQRRHEVHVKDHSLPTKFNCTECGMKFHRVREHKNHLMNKHGIGRLHKCDKCPRSFNQGYQLQLHLETHSSKKSFPCLKCDRSFIKARNLEHHEYTYHGEGKLECKLCNRKLSCPIRFRAHMKYHDNSSQYKCSTCGKSYASKGTLNRHMRVHSGALIKCNREGCSYQTHYDWLFRAHEISHTGIKPLKCSFCWKGFYTKRSQRKHEEKSHGYISDGTENSQRRRTVLETDQQDSNSINSDPVVPYHSGSAVMNAISAIGTKDGSTIHDRDMENGAMSCEPTPAIEISLEDDGNSCKITLPGGFVKVYSRIAPKRNFQPSILRRGK